MKICHIADVHWRALIRHDEYRKVFEALKNSVCQKGVDVIFIGGDIYHTKTSGLSPEYIESIACWFRDLSSVAPVHVILGNHDGNLVNLTRQDAVSPIVAALNSDRIFLYKKSGSYPLSAEIDLCVFSVFDLEGWKNVSPTKGKINIACYHGPLKGAKTDEGWEIDSDLKVEDFKDYDFALLGDIHTKQYMDYRICKDGGTRPWIAYPGSTIQQNYGETIDGHGYLLWDIRSSEDYDVEFIEIPNDHPFVTLDWEGDVKKIAQKYPEKSRFRIRSQAYIPQKEAREITNWLRNRGALEVVFKVERDIDRTALQEESKKLVSDIRNVDALLDYMKKYAEHATHQFSVDDWSEIEKIVRSSIKGLDIEGDIVRHIKWSLKNVEWDNLFSYGESNVIDFSKMNGIVGILGPNRVGKSSLIGMMTYAMFNTTDRGSIKNVAMVNERKMHGVVKADLTTAQGDYYLERQTVKKENRKGELGAVTTLNFYSKNSDDLSDLNGEQRNDTEKVIRRLIGSFDDFAMTGLSRQGDLNRFINEGSTQRKSILTRFLDLDFLEKLYESVKLEMSNVKYMTKGLYENYDSRIEKAESDVLSVATNLQEKENDLNVLKIKIEELKREYVEASKGSRPITKEDVAVQSSVVKKLETSLSAKRSELQSLSDEIRVLNEKKKKIESLDSEYDLDELKKQYHDQTKLETELAQKRAKYEKELDILRSREKSAKKLLEVPCGDSFPTCKFIRDSHQDKASIPDQKARVKEALSFLDNVKSLLGELKNQNIRDKIEKLEKLKSAYSSMNLQIVNKEASSMRIDDEISTMEKKLSDERVRLDDLIEASSSNASKECDRIKKELTRTQETCSQCERDVRGLYAEKGRLEHEISRLKKSKEDSEKTLSLVKLYEFVVQSLSKKGIPALILRSQLPIINAEVEKILRGIVDFTIEFELDDDLNSMDVYLSYGDSRRLIELCSGMEKTIASIAIRVALINITSLPKPDFLVLDEGFGTLDSNNVEACGRLLRSLKKYFRFVMVITHVDVLKDYVDNTIEIMRKEKDSYVSFS